MKIQTTLEFIIILTVISSLIVLSLSIYASISKESNLLFNSISNSPTITSQNNSMIISYESGAPKIFAYIGNLSEMGIPNYGYLEVLSNDKVIILNLSMSTNNGQLIYDNFNKSISGFEMINFNYIPKHRGISNITIKLKAKTDNGILNKEIKLNTYVYDTSITPINTTISDYKPQIAFNSKYEYFNLNSLDSIYKISTSSHCSYNYYHSNNQEPISIQCGPNASYDFFIFSSYCYYDKDIFTRTICVYKNYNNSEVGIINKNNPNYGYNASIKIQDLNSVMDANVSTLNHNHTPLIENGTITGNITVNNAYTNDTYNIEHSGILFNNQTNYSLNESFVNDFEISKSNLNSILNFYNNSNVSAQQLNNIYESMNNYNRSVKKIYSNSYHKKGCKIINHTYKCNLNFIQLYMTAYIENITSNYVYYYNGSKIYIR